MDLDGPGAAAPDDNGDAPGYVPLGPADPDRVASFAALADLDEAHDPGPLTEMVDAVGIVPAVVAVIVTHNAGDWLDETLGAFVAQGYANLSVLVIDTGSAIDPTPRIAHAMPGAFVRRLDHNPGFGPALNEVLELVEGASFLLLCHDDIAPDPDTVHLLVEEAFRSNAGVVGPKLVAWDDPDVLLQVGLAGDRTGASSPYAERGELDQQQHDAVRDVFTVPGACTLVRTDLFSHLGGVDPSLELIGEDLDLSWRAHLVGARVVVAPAARVRHREAMAERRPDVDIVRLEAHHRLRTMLSCAGRWSLPFSVLRAGLATLIDALLCVVTGRGNEARALLSAWPSALRHLGGIRSMRRHMRAIRKVSDRDVADLQIRTAARLAASLQTRRRQPEGLAASERRRDLAHRAGRDDWSLLAVWMLVGVTLFGTRSLLFGHVPAIGDFARIHEGPTELIASFLRGWRDTGLGSNSPAPPAVGAFGVLGLLFGGAMGVLRQVVILGLLPIGMWGAWRLARPLQSRRAQVAALVIYTAAPVSYNALSQGRWASLALCAAAPWLLAALGRATGTAPFGPRRESGETAPSQPRTEAGRARRWWVQSLGLGLGLAVVAILAPVVVGVLLVMVLGVVLGSLLAFRVRGAGRLAGVAVGGVVVALVLHLPWTLGYLDGGVQWSSAIGPRAGSGTGLSLVQLLRFESGPFGRTPLGYALPLAGVLPLLVGRGWRFAWAVRAWGVALVCWAVVWLGEAGWLRVPLPAPEVFLAPAAAALALAAAMGVAAFEVDLPGYRFGWRQAASGITAVAIVVTALPWVVTALPGRWKVPGGDVSAALPFIREARDKDAFRVLWAGDPAALPVGAWRLDDHLSYATTNAGDADLDEVWAPVAPGASAGLGEALQLAVSGQTTRLGAVLAPMGVRYLVVPSRLVPTPYSSDDHPPPAALPAALAAQLDLREVPANPALTVYLNTAWTPQPTLLAPETRLSGRSLEAPTPSTGGTPVLAGADAQHRSGVIPRPGVVATDQAADGGWSLAVDGKPAAMVTLDGWRQGFRVPVKGDATLSRQLSTSRLLLVGAQVLLWLVVLELRRRGGRVTTVPLTDVDVSTEAAETVVAAGDTIDGPVRVRDRVSDRPGGRGGRGGKRRAGRSRGGHGTDDVELDAGESRARSEAIFFGSGSRAATDLTGEQPVAEPEPETDPISEVSPVAESVADLAAEPAPEIDPEEQP